MSFERWVYVSFWVSVNMRHHWAFKEPRRHYGSRYAADDASFVVSSRSSLPG